MGRGGRGGSLAGVKVKEVDLGRARLRRGGVLLQLGRMLQKRKGCSPSALLLTFSLLLLPLTGVLMGRIAQLGAE